MVGEGVIGEDKDGCRGDQLLEFVERGLLRLSSMPSNIFLSEVEEGMCMVRENLRKQDVILGFTWLQEHNPEIDWWTWKVVMSWCPDKCHMCRMDVWKQ